MNDHYDDIFIEHIRKNAPGYFPRIAADKTSVILRVKQERPSATLYKFNVTDETRAYSIVVKVPLRNLLLIDARETIYEKPSLFQKADAQDMHWLQYTALTSIYEYFANLNNEQLGAIHVLDYLPQYQAILMEESRDPSLQRLFLREHRLHLMLNEHDLTSAFRNAGKWLQKYHTMPKEDGVQIRHQNREDYFEAILKLTDFLSKAWGDEAFFKQTASIVVQNGREILPEALPLGLGHGDYAMRNILIGANDRVTILDTFAKWRVPIYEDIGYFLNGLRTSYSQVVTQGLLFSDNQIAAYEKAFLQGYFESTNIPYLNIRLYEALALLDKWSSVINNYHRRSAKLKNFGGVKALMTSRYFKKYTLSLLKQISEVETSRPYSALEKIF